MNTICLLASLLIAASGTTSEEVWTLRGRVTDPGDNPLMGAVVMILGTSFGAMTDQNGEYLISNIPIDHLSCQARMVGMGQSTIEVYASPGDTAEVHFYLPANPSNPLERPVITIDQQLAETVFTDTLEIVLGNWRELDVKHGQCWGSDELLPSWQENDSTVCALLPRNTDSLHLSVFPGREIRVAVPGNSNRLRTQVPMDPPEGIMLNRYRPAVEYGFIDLAQWGNSRYRNWGLLGTELIYADNGQSIALLVYHENAVLINGSGEAKTIEFPFPTLQYTCDPELKYLLIWDIYGQDGTSGNVALIDLENGNRTIFDPTPEIDESEGHFAEISFDTVINPFQGVRHHLTSSGAVFIVEEDSYRSLDNTGSLLCNVAWEEIGIERFYYTDQFLSMDQTAISAIFTDGVGVYCITIDLHGNVMNFSPLPLPPLEWGRFRSAVDQESAVLWGSVHGNGIGVARIDCLSGDCLYRPGLRTIDIFPSGDRSQVGVVIFSNTNPGYTVLETWDFDTGERRSSLQEAYTDPSPVLAYIKSVTDDGSFLGVTPSRQAGEEGNVFIMNSDGEVIWKSPPLPGRALLESCRSTNRKFPNPPASISPDGSTMILPNGRYIILVHFGEEELLQ